MNIKIRGVVQILLFFYLLFGWMKMGFGQEITIDYSEKLHIEEQEDEFLIGNLFGLAVDHEKNIYLFDQIPPKVEKMDSEGNHIAQIIEAGRGPGEINGLNSFYLNADREEILLADRENQRTTIVDLDGDEVEIISMNPSDMNLPTKMLHHQKEEYIFMFYLGERQALRQQKGVDSLFHVYDTDKTERMYSFGDRKSTFELLGYDGGGAVDQTKVMGGDILINDETFIFAPYVYDGKMIRYEYSSGKWENADLVNGKEWSRPAFENFEKDSFEDYRENRQEYEEMGRNVFSSFSQNSSSVGLLNSRAAGLFKHGNYVLHFTVTEHEAKGNFIHKLHVEVFDHNWNYLGSEIIKKGEEQQVLWNVDARDDEGNFYMTIRSAGSGLSKAIKFSLDIEQE